MPDFFLEPDEIEPARPEHRTPPRLVSTGLAPTAEVPTVRAKGKDAQPAYAPCVLCGQPVLTGATLHGHTLHLDVGATCYALAWPNAATVPTLLPSRAYPVHHCAGQGA
jgi:hypothetical protein